MSTTGRRLLIKWEGVVPTVYKDAAGLLTIGVGHLLTQDEITSGKIWIGECFVRYRDGLTAMQIEELLEQDLEPREAFVASLVSAEVNQNQFDALVSFVFNVGGRAFSRSTLLKRVNEGRFNEVPDQFRRWIYAGGVVVRGLKVRRENEIRLWRGEQM